MTLAKRNSNLTSSLPGLFDDFFTRDLFDWGNSIVRQEPYFSSKSDYSIRWKTR